MKYENGYIEAKLGEWILFFSITVALILILLSCGFQLFLNRNSPKESPQPIFTMGPFTSMDSVILNGKLGRLQGYRDEYTFSPYDSSSQEVVKITEREYAISKGNTLLYRQRVRYSFKKKGSSTAGNRKKIRYLTKDPRWLEIEQLSDNCINRLKAVASPKLR